MTTLYDSLKSSYGDEKARKKIESNGYTFDDILSNDNQQVYYNKDKKDILFNVAGTHNLSDIGTDIYLGLGGLKNSNRYKEAENILKVAKDKYKPSKTTVTGHSLGSSIGSYIAGSNDIFYGLDGGYTAFQPTRSYNGNHHTYRTSGDAVSLLSSGAKHVQTLANPNTITGILPLDILQAHNINNIKNEKIFL